MSYNSPDIRWVKSVKRNAGSDWAYEELSCEVNNLEISQKLHWRTDIGQTAAAHPKVGEIILLFQTLNHGPYKGIVHLTHLVSPVSELVLPDPSNKAYKWYREVKLIAKAEPMHSIPKPGILNFGRVGNGGLTFSVDLLSNANINTESVQNLIWGLFDGFFCADAVQPDIFEYAPIDVDGQSEGDTELRKHLEQEIRNRSSQIVYAKKQEGLRKGNGRLLCECCDCDFVEKYGQLGKGFIECHHRIFLSEGERITSLENLALVCSNCHRMLHRRNSINKHYSVEELRDIIKNKTVA